MHVKLVENSTEMAPMPADKLVSTMVSTNAVLLETWARHDCPLDAVYIVVRLTYIHHPSPFGVAQPVNFWTRSPRTYHGIATAGNVRWTRHVS